MAVFGAGAVGLAAIMAAKVAAAGAIIAVDVHDERLALAKELGATHVIKVGDGDVGEQLRAITGRGVDFVLDTRSEEHTSELQSLLRLSYAVFCLKKKNNKQHKTNNIHNHTK